MTTRSIAAIHVASAKASPLTSKAYTYSVWSWIGAIFIALEAYVLLSWVYGPIFVRTSSGDNPIGQASPNILMADQIDAHILAILCILFRVVRPWRREGRMTTDSILALGMVAIVIYDLVYNDGSTGLFYGETYLLPIYEGILFGGLTIGATAIMMFYKHNKGEAFVKHGIDQPRFTPATKQWLRFRALFRLCSPHLFYLLFYHDELVHPADRCFSRGLSRLYGKLDVCLRCK